METLTKFVELFNVLMEPIFYLLDSSHVHVSSHKYDKSWQHVN